MITLTFTTGKRVGVGLILASKIYHKAAEKMRGEAFTVKESMPVEEELIRVNFTKLRMYESIMKKTHRTCWKKLTHKSFWKGKMRSRR